MAIASLVIAVFALFAAIYALSSIMKRGADIHKLKYKIIYLNEQIIHMETQIEQERVEKQNRIFQNEPVNQKIIQPLSVNSLTIDDILHQAESSMNTLDKFKSVSRRLNLQDNDLAEEMNEQ